MFQYKSEVVTCMSIFSELQIICKKNLGQKYQELLPYLDLGMWITHIFRVFSKPVGMSLVMINFSMNIVLGSMLSTNPVNIKYVFSNDAQNKLVKICDNIHNNYNNILFFGI